MTGTTARILPDGRRAHFQHGPIDLVIEAFGPEGEVRAAYRQAWERFAPILDELVSELPALRRPLSVEGPPALRGTVARRMEAAVGPFRDRFVTPMAAVAGAVADEVLAALCAGRELHKAYVNDGGDIAFHLAPGQSLRAAAIADLREPMVDSVLTLDAERPGRGLATSGRGGRSFSLGVADAVTVLARSAAEADAAATMIANAVDVDHPAVVRVPACALDPDSDLGDHPVTTAVGRLDPASVETALAAGVAEAERCRAAGLILGAVLALQGAVRIVGSQALAVAAHPPPPQTRPSCPM